MVQVQNFLAAQLGFEPRLTASKAAVLPLDDRALIKTNLYLNVR